MSVRRDTSKPIGATSSLPGPAGCDTSHCPAQSVCQPQRPGTDPNGRASQVPVGHRQGGRTVGITCDPLSSFSNLFFTQDSTRSRMDFKCKFWSGVQTLGAVTVKVGHGGSPAQSVLEVCPPDSGFAGWGSWQSERTGPVSIPRGRLGDSALTLPL